MKKLLSIVLTICMSLNASAQQSAYKKSVARYKNTAIVTASVVKTVHKNAVAQDKVTNGQLTMKKPSEVSIVMEGAKDQLIMQGSTFTMVMKGKKHVTSSEHNPQFASFKTVFESILSGGMIDVSGLQDLSIVQKGSQVILTITPVAEGKKGAKRMLFSSFVLVIDTKTSALKSLRMNERAGYTEYVFTNHQFK